jgi:hypothetical protein
MLIPLDEVVPELPVLVLAPLLTRPHDAELPDREPAREPATANTKGHHQQR